MLILLVSVVSSSEPFLEPLGNTPLAAVYGGVETSEAASPEHVRLMGEPARTERVPLSAAFADRVQTVGRRAPADLTCTRDTSKTCRMYDCDSDSFGDPVLGSFECVDHACLCKEGFCADGNGNCVSKKSGRVLPGEYTISYTRMTWHWVNPVNATKERLYLRFSEWFRPYVSAEEVEGDAYAKWTVIVNNDNTILLQSAASDEYYLTVQLACSRSCGRDCSVPYNCADTESAKSPATIAFRAKAPFGSSLPANELGGELRVVEGRGVHLQHAETGYYMAGHNMDGKRFSATEWIFDPPLPAELLSVATVRTHVDDRTFVGFLLYCFIFIMIFAVFAKVGFKRR